MEEKQLEPLNAYKLMEAPYMADKLKENDYDTFMELLKQSEVELANKIMDLINEVNSLKKKLQ